MADVNHANRAHALLSASGASRWLNCPPSAKLEEKQQQSGSTVYAREGTLAHELADLTLRYELGMLDKKTFNAELKRVKSDDLYEDDMSVQVQKFVDICLEVYNGSVAENGSAEALVEQRLDYSHIVEMGFGTGDYVNVSDNVLEVIDLKYGKGIQVEAEKNSQLMLYGVGALAVFDMVYEIEFVKLTIVQPRLDHYSTYTISVDSLIGWAEDVVKPIAVKAYKGEGRKHPGDWCKFCKVKGICKAYADKNIELAKHEFKDPHLLSVEDLAVIKSQIPMLVDWANAVDSYLLKEALLGNVIPGYKVVEGRSNRKWTNEKDVIETLTTLKYPREKFISEKLQGITTVEKLVGRANINQILGDLIIKPPGKPTLTEESDKRPAMGFEQAKLDFADDVEGVED